MVQLCHGEMSGQKLPDIEHRTQPVQWERAGPEIAVGDRWTAGSAIRGEFISQPVAVGGRAEEIEVEVARCQPKGPGVVNRRKISKPMDSATGSHGWVTPIEGITGVAHRVPPGELRHALAKGRIIQCLLPGFDQCIQWEPSLRDEHADVERQFALHLAKPLLRECEELLERRRGAVGGKKELAEHRRAGQDDEWQVGLCLEAASVHRCRAPRAGQPRSRRLVEPRFDPALFERVLDGAHSSRAMIALLKLELLQRVHGQKVLSALVETENHQWPRPQARDNDAVGLSCPHSWHCSGRRKAQTLRASGESLGGNLADPCIEKSLRLLPDASQPGWRGVLGKDGCRQIRRYQAVTHIVVDPPTEVLQEWND